MGLTDPKPGSADRPLVVWAVSDGRAGIEAQALGLAEAVSALRPSRIERKCVGWPAAVGWLPWWLIPPALRTGDPVGPPWPDVWIATGRATLPLSTRVRRWSGGKTFVVQTQDPRTSLKPFDLVVPPAHDRLEGANVFPIVGAPNRLTPAKLADAGAEFSGRINDLPRPRIAMIVGGPSKVHRLPATLARTTAEQVAATVRASGGSLLLSFTRRTPADVRELMNSALADVPGWIWDGQEKNPYLAFLATADAILVTQDSTNLATDAASTGKPVYVLPMEGHSTKIARLHRDLAARGIARPFRGAVGASVYEPLRETERAARELLRRYDLAVIER